MLTFGNLFFNISIWREPSSEEMQGIIKLGIVTIIYILVALVNGKVMQ